MSHTSPRKQGGIRDVQGRPDSTQPCNMHNGGIYGKMFSQQLSYDSYETENKQENLVIKLRCEWHRAQEQEVPYAARVSRSLVPVQDSRSGPHGRRTFSHSGT